MITRTRVLCGILAACLGALTACATTQITKVWKDDAFEAGPVRKIFVIGISGRPEVRKFFEDEFVAELKARGVEAIPSHPIMPSEEKIDKETVTSKIKDLGVGGVLVTRLLAREEEKRYLEGTTYFIPPDLFLYTNYFQRERAFTESPGRTVDDEVALLETNLYDARTSKLIWSARSETWLMGVDKGLIRAFIKTMIDKLFADKLIA